MADEPNEPGGNKPTDPQPGGGQGDKIFTQADVDKIIQKRLGEDRQRRSKEGLSDAERDRFANKIESLERQVTNLIAERDTANTKAKEAEKASTTLRGQVKAERISRAIGTAATKAGALDPGAVSKLMGPKTVRMREVTDDGQPTGEYVVEVRVEVERDGKQTTEWTDAETGVKAFLEAEAPYLIKSESPPGAGTAPAANPARGAPEGSQPSGSESKAPEGVKNSGVASIGHLPQGASAESGSIGDLMDRGAASMLEKLKNQ